MAMPHNGLVKLVEECGELVQIASKKISYHDTDAHPDGKGSMRMRLENEIADVTASVAFVVEKLGLSLDRIETMADHKLRRFEAWDEEGKASEALDKRFEEFNSDPGRNNG